MPHVPGCADEQGAQAAFEEGFALREVPADFLDCGCDQVQDELIECGGQLCVG